MIDCTQLRLAVDLRILRLDRSELRLRRGVWNFYEAQLRFDKEQDSDLIYRYFKILQEGKQPSQELCSQLERSTEARQTLEELFHNGYLIQKTAAEFQLSQLFLGKKSPPKHQDLTALLFSDTPTLAEEFCKRSTVLDCKVSQAHPQLYTSLQTQDDTANIDPVSESRREAREQLAAHRLFIFLQERLDVLLLRNVNAYLLQRFRQDPEQAGYLLLVYSDGPFSGLCLLKPGESACFGCLEQRIIARLEDHVLYERFVEQKSCPKLQQGSLYSPLLQWQSDLALGEFVTLSQFGLSKMIGKLLNFYVPSYEIQYQNILRSSQCPACGYAAQAQLRELNTNSEQLLSRLRS